MRAGLRGDVRPPGDKSISHRALILAALAEGESRIAGLNPGADVAATTDVLAALGTDIEREDDVVRVRGGDRAFVAPGRDLWCANSGTTMRLMSGVLAGQPFRSRLAGDPSLSARPMERVAEPLRRMGARVETVGGHAPVTIDGGALRAIEHRTPVASAQIKSAVLLAGLCASGETRVTEPALSRDHTERMLARMGAPIRRSGLTVSIRAARLEPIDIRVPGDPSAAAFYVCAALLVPGSRIRIRWVGANPTRTGYLAVLGRMGARIARHEAGDAAGEPVEDLEVSSATLRGTVIAADEIPSLIDEVPILAIAAACAETATEFFGASELRVKETDRLSALAAGLRILGVEVDERPDGLRVAGGGFRRGGRVDARGDHRIAMSFGVAALCAPGPVEIEGSESASVSDPGFGETLARLASD